MKIVIEPRTGPISELIEAFGFDAKQLALFDYFQTLGEVHTAFFNDEFVCCWGLIPPSFLSNEAYLWMWTDTPVKYMFAFIRQSQIQIDRMLEQYDELVGDCVMNTTAKRYVRLLGGEFGEPKGNVIPFRIRKRDG